MIIKNIQIMFTMKVKKLKYSIRRISGAEDFVKNISMSHPESKKRFFHLANGYEFRME